MLNSGLRTALVQALGKPGPGSSDFDLNPEVLLPENRVLRSAGVLLAISDSATPLLILTKRASHLKHHPGQIAFPGGKVEKTDADITGAALREAEEEIGLGRENVNIIGTLPAHETVTGFRVTPVLGIIRAEFDPIPELGEVEEVFAVPLHFLLDASNYRIEYRFWRGHKRYYYTVPFGPYYIWGATARMLRELAERMGQ